MALQLHGGDGVWRRREKGWTRQCGSAGLSPAVLRAAEAARLPPVFCSLEGCPCGQHGQGFAGVSSMCSAFIPDSFRQRQPRRGGWSPPILFCSLHTEREIRAPSSLSTMPGSPGEMSFRGQGLKFASTGLRTSACTGPVLWLTCRGYGHLPLKRSKPLESSRFPL